MASRGRHVHHHAHGAHGEAAHGIRWTELREATSAALARLLARFGDFDPAQQVVDGLHIPWSEVGSCALWIGLVWTGVAGVLAAVVWGRRELARAET